MRRAASFCVVLCACGFQVNSGTPGPGSDAPPAIDAPAIDAPADGAIDSATDGPPVDMPVDAGVVPCMSSAPMDDFSAATPCTPWATYDQTRATVVQTGGKLRITPSIMTVMNTHGGCIATGLSAFTGNGVFVSVDTALTGTTAYTVMTAYVATGTGAGIVVKNGTISLFNPTNAVVAGSASYDAPMMKWWWLKPAAGGGVEGWVSADMVAWRLLGTVSGPATTMVRIDLSAGTDTLEATAGTAVFDNLNVCP